MKKYLFLLAFVLLLVSCNGKVEISVFNNSEIDRTDEMVELCLCELSEFDATKLVVLDADGKQVPCQILYKGGDKPQALLFPVTLKAGTQALFTLKEGTPEKFAARTHARFVPERKDDMSWENDRIGFRMYGPALVAENPSNGVDVWLKRTTSLVFDKWYKDDLAHKASYHEDHGEGLDCYGVGHTLGCGGICPYSNDSLWIGNQFDRYKVLDNGPLRSSFVLFYDAVPCGSKTLKAELLVNLDAGSNLNEARIKYTGDTADIMLAAGIFLHDTIQSTTSNAVQGFIAYAEDASYLDKNKVKVALGRCYTGVVFPDEVLETKQMAGHLIGVSKYKVGDEFRYFFGAGWSKHGFKKDSDWITYLAAKRISLQEPLKVKLLK